MPAQDPDAFVRSKEKSPNHESNSGLCPEPWAKKDAGLWRVRPDSGIRKGAERDLTTGPCLSKDRENVFSAHGLSPDVRRVRFGYGIFLPIRLSRQYGLFLKQREPGTVCGFFKSKMYKIKIRKITFHVFYRNKLPEKFY